jgi:hypothetical protein
MTWVKLDDGFPDHPKVLRAGGAAAWLYVSGLCYCGRFLTDGVIPESALAKLTDARSPQQLAAKLVSVGMWERIEDGWMVHDYGKYQRTKARVEADREGAKERQSRKRHGVTSPEVTAPEVEKSRSTEAEAENTSLSPHQPGVYDPQAMDDASLPRATKVELALRFSADTTVNNARLDGVDIRNLAAYTRTCYIDARDRYGAALHKAAHQNPDWSAADLLRVVDEFELPVAPVTELRAMRRDCECGWTPDHELPHNYVHAEWVAS